MVRRKKTPPPRRKKGTGSVYQRKSDGRWVYALPPVNGVKHTDYADTEEEAERLLGEALMKIKTGTFIPPDRITVGEWLAEWWENAKPLYPRANSRYHYETTLNSRLKVLESIPLQKLTSRKLQDLATIWAGEGLKASTIHSYFSLLGVALDSAVKHGIIADNPCRRVELPKIERKKPQALTLDQVQLLMIEIHGHWLEPWVTIGVGTGMRVGELGSLRWEDIDFEAHIIHVVRNVARIPGEFEEGPPKTEAGRRDIVIPDFVLEELLALQRAQLLKKGERGLGWNRDGLVLPHDDGGYRNADVVNETFQGKLKHAGLPIITFHSLRHSAVRIMQFLGIPLEIIQKIVGHGSIKMTADIYGDVSTDMQQDAMVRVNSAFKRTKKQA